MSPTPQTPERPRHFLTLEEDDELFPREGSHLLPLKSKSDDAASASIKSEGREAATVVARKETPRQSGATSIRNKIFTPPNFKVVLSFLIWYGTYMGMALLGGSIAYLNFPRVEPPSDRPHALPDYGHAIIPYWCPEIPFIPHENIQSAILLGLYVVILAGVAKGWSERGGGEGRLILQRLFHLNSLVFVTRTTVVGITGLYQPNPWCVPVQSTPVTSYREAYDFVVGRSFPPHACGDLIYSGHVACILVCVLLIHRHGYVQNGMSLALVWSASGLGVYGTISCRSHYTVDVILAFYFVYGIAEFYFLRSEGVLGGSISNWIQWLEVRQGGEDKTEGNDDCTENVLV